MKTTINECVHLSLLFVAFYLGSSVTDCFQFTKKPQNPLVVVLGVNSTNIELTWEFNITESDDPIHLKIIRFKKKHVVDTEMELCLILFSNGKKKVDKTKYKINANGTGYGYANFIIRDVLDQGNNQDDTPVDVQLEGVVYQYKVDLTLLKTLSIPSFDVIDLNVLLKPRVLNVPKLLYRRLGKTVNIWANASGKPLPSLYGNSSINRTPKILDGGLLSFNITSNTSFCVEARNGIGSDTKCGSVVVREPPAFRTKFHKYSLTSSSVIFDCSATGIPKPTVTLIDEQNVTVRTNMNGYFHIPRNYCVDSTMIYYCKASNEKGISVRSAVIEVRVQAGSNCSVNNTSEKDVIILIVVATIVPILFILLFVFILIQWRNKHLQENTNASQIEGHRMNVPIAEESPYGEPVDAIHAVQAQTDTTHNHQIHGSAEEENAYAIVYNSKSPKKKSQGPIEALYAKVNKKNKKKEQTQGAVPVPLYEEIPGQSSKHSASTHL